MSFKYFELIKHCLIEEKLLQPTLDPMKSTSSTVKQTSNNSAIV